MSTLPENMALLPGLAVVSLSLVRMAANSAFKNVHLCAAVTQKKNCWPTLDHDGRWIYGTYTIWGRK